MTKLKGLRLPIMLVACLAMVAGLYLIYLRTQERTSSYFQNVALLRQLQQLDARWELDVIKAKVGLNTNYDALVAPLHELAQIRQRFDQSVREDLTAAAPALLASSAKFGRAIQEKTRLVEHFKSHNSVLHNSLAFLPTATADLQNAVLGRRDSASRSQWNYAGQTREILLQVLVYNESPSRNEANRIQSALESLSDDPMGLRGSVRDRLSIYEMHVRTILRERPRVNSLLRDIDAVPTGLRIGELDNALAHVHQLSEESVKQSRQLLLLLSVMLVALLLYLAIKLMRSYSNLERRVEERTAALLSSNIEMRQQEGRLILQAQELAEARDVAQAANEAKSAFLATMSHELRTPLNAIIGFSEMMLTQIFGPLGHSKYVEYLTDVNKSGSHLLALINDILDLSRLDAGKGELRDDTFSVAGLISEVCRSVMPLARQGKLSMETELDPQLPLLLADQRRVRQVMLNLVSNAVKFTPAGGSVTVKAELDTECRLVIQVADTGIGMSKDELPKALERFGQVDSSLARKYEGTGLGLPVAKQLIEIHDGEFKISSETGIGTTATVVFPHWRTINSASAEIADLAVA